MSDTILRGQVWHENGFAGGRVTLDGGTIAAVEADPDAPHDSFITPGLIDVQLNGGLGEDFTANPEAIARVATALPRWGVTLFLPTFVTAPMATYRRALAYLRDAPHPEGAIIGGAHLEGPFLNPRYKGVHDAALMRLPSQADLTELLSYPALRYMTVAPELPGALDLIRGLADAGVVVALGHSGATYDDAMAGYDAGASSTTHLFNAMPPLHHRVPGLVGAALDHPVAYVTFIPDGVHLDPAIVRLIWRQRGVAGIILVTDSLAAMGMAAGVYDIGGRQIRVDGAAARAVDNPAVLAGSILTMDEALRRMLRFTGCSFYQAISMASLNPARLLGLDHCKGRVQVGYDGDLTVFDADFVPRQTYVGGVLRYTR